MANETQFQVVCDPITWVPIKSQPFLYDVDFTGEECGGTDTLSNDYAVIEVDQSGVTIVNENEIPPYVFSCKTMQFNKYGQFFAAAPRCMDRAINIFECAQKTLESATERVAIGWNLAILRDIKSNSVNLSCYDSLDATPIYMSIYDYNWGLHFGGNICFDNGENEMQDCRYYVTQTGLIKTDKGTPFDVMSQRAQLQFLLQDVELVSVQATTSVREIPTNVIGLRSLLGNALHDDGLLPKDSMYVLYALRANFF